MRNVVCHVFHGGLARNIKVGGRGLLSLFEDEAGQSDTELL